MDNNIDIFFDDNKNLNPCLIDEDIIKKIIDTKDTNNDTIINKWYLIVLDYLYNNVYNILIGIVIFFFLLYRFYINDSKNNELNELERKKNLIIDTLIKKYEKNNNVKEIINDQKDIEIKQKKIINNLNKIKKKKKHNITNYDNQFTNYYHI